MKTPEENGKGPAEEALGPGFRVIVADDEESMRFFLERSLSRRGYEVETVERGDDAVTRYEARPFDVAVLDLKMPGADGIEVLRSIRAADPEALVIIMTAYGTIRSAVEAMKQGAFDYITKPFEIDELLLLMERALERRATLRENRDLRQMIDHRRAYGGLIGQSPAMRAVYQTIDLLRGSDATVLITGESGTGKELLARAIHLHSHRRLGDFVPLNCAAFPESLFESELFGHEAGAFTGAVRCKRGLVEGAAGGTLFLDEISETSPGAQIKLVRFLQDKKFTPLGSSETRPVDLRIITATNRDLEKLVDDGAFRQDLYWRLNVVPIHLPPLRERREDIPVLVSHFLKRFGRSGGETVQGFTLEAMITLSGYPWPGNVRELENTVERMVVLHGDKETLGVEDLPQAVRDQAGSREVSAAHEGIPIDGAPSSGTAHGRARTGKEPVPYPEAFNDFEKSYLEMLLGHAGGNISQAARLSGISRSNLHQKIKHHGLDPGRFRE